MKVVNAFFLACAALAAHSLPATACSRWATANRDIGSLDAPIAAVCANAGRNSAEIFIHCRAVKGKAGFGLRLSRSVVLKGRKAGAPPRRVVLTFASGNRRSRLTMTLDRADKRYVALQLRSHPVYAMIVKGKRLRIRRGRKGVPTTFSLAGAGKAVRKVMKMCQ